MKRQKSSKDKPTRDTAETPLTHGDHVRAILKNEHAKLRRRYMLAKDALKNGVHVDESLAVLRQVVKSRELTLKAKDLALRLLARYERKAKSGVMKLPESYREIIGTVAGPHEWISDAEWAALAADGKKGWMPDYDATRLKNAADEEPGKDDD